MAKQGLFIVFEGIDGSGTSTHVHKLEERIENLNKYQDILRTHEPWKNKEIKRKLEQDKDAYSDAAQMAELYVEDRARHTQKLIRPNLEAGTIVLCSRYTLSTCSYQWSQGLNLPELIKMHEHRGILTPDITFFLDVPSEVAHERRKRRASKEKFEYDPVFINKLINAYKSLIHMSEVDQGLFGKIVKVNANRSLDEVSSTIFSRFLPLYNSWVSS